MTATKKLGKAFRGEKGASVFYKPISLGFEGHNKKETLPDFIQRLKGTTDHRSLALLGALVLEHHLDEILRAFLPKYSKLTDKSQNFTLSLKIATLAALNLIPEHLVGCADAVREVRNAFAHHLALDSFENLEPKIRARISTRWHETVGHIGEPVEKTVSEEYWDVLFFSIGGLCFYLSNVLLLRSRIDELSFIENLEKTAQESDMKAIDDLIENGIPISTEYQDGLKIETYPGKIVHVSDR